MITPEDIERFNTVKAELLPLATASELDADGITRYNELSAEFDELAPKIEDHEQFQAKRQGDLERMKRLNPTAGVERGVESFEFDALTGDDLEKPSTFKNPWDIDAVSRSRNVDDLVSRALSAVEQTPGPDDVRRQALYDMIEHAEQDQDRIANLALATTSPAYKQAYGKIARAGGDLNRADLNGTEREAVRYAESVRRAMSQGTDNTGGYLVPTDIEAAVTLSADGTNNPIYNVARRVQTTSDTYRVVMSPNAAWSWDGENTEVSDDTPTFANTDIPLYIAQGFVPYSYASNHGISGVQGIVASVLMGGWNDLVGAALTTGTGSSQPTGITKALDGTSSEIAPATAETFAVADVYATRDAIAGRHRRNAQWFAEISTLSAMRQFATDDGHALLARLGEGEDYRLLGKTITENEDMRAFSDLDAGASEDNFLLLFGDFSHYVVAEGLGTVTRFIPDVVGSNGRPIGASGIFMQAQFGADSVLNSAFSMLSIPTTA